MTTPTPVTRYTWTTTGLTPNFECHGAMRYVRETDYEQLERDLAARDAELADLRIEMVPDRPVDDVDGTDLAAGEGGH